MKEYKNLFTSDGLCPTLKDLDQIFDNSDDAASGDETVRLVSEPFIYYTSAALCLCRNQTEIIAILVIVRHNFLFLKPMDLTFLK